MPVRYVRVNPLVNLFAPAVRAFGNIAVVGRLPEPVDTLAPKLDTPSDTLADPLAETPAAPVPATAFTSPDDAKEAFPGELGNAIAYAFAQTPGPSLIYGVPVDHDEPDWAGALATVAGLNVQIVVFVGTVVDADSVLEGGPIQLLSDHVTAVSSTGADGGERIGVAMLPKGSKAAGTILSNERMVYVAHNSDQDAAVAVAGTIAGYEPWVSMLLKPVNIVSPPFSPADVDALNGDETFRSGPAGKGVNWLTSPALIPGNGVFLGEGYTGKPESPKRYIDIVRTVDHVSFLLKAQLIGSIGMVRISRPGLRALIAQMEAILGPLVDEGVLNSFEVVVPVLTLLDKDPATLTAGEAQAIQNAQANRLVEVLAAVKYASAVHRISISLKFD